MEICLINVLNGIQKTSEIQFWQTVNLLHCTSGVFKITYCTRTFALSAEFLDVIVSDSAWAKLKGMALGSHERTVHPVFKWQSWTSTISPSTSSFCFCQVLGLAALTASDFIILHYPWVQLGLVDSPAMCFITTRHGEYTSFPLSV